MGTLGNPYRHVVFTEAERRRPLNLGARGGSAMRELPRRTAQSFEEATYGDGLTEDDAFIGWVFRQQNLKLYDYRPGSLRRRVPACLRALRVKHTTHARPLLRRNPNLVQLALDLLLLGVTEFFRDKPVFECLERQLSGIAQSASPQRRLRIWSAGCSDGAELYSVAMLLAEMNVLSRCDLLGTDCRPEAVRRAAAGWFGPTFLAGVSPERLERHFETVTHDNATEQPRQIRSCLREQISWQPGDALTRVEDGAWDVLLCRNMAMYLQPAVAENLWRRLAAALRPGGMLVLGKAERPMGAAPFLSQVGPCVYRRHGEL